MLFADPPFSGCAVARPSVGELFKADLLIFEAVDGVSYAPFLFIEPLVDVVRGVLGTKPSILRTNHQYNNTIVASFGTSRSEDVSAASIDCTPGRSM